MSTAAPTAPVTPAAGHNTAQLAIEGGEPVRKRPMPPRLALGDAEAAAIAEVLAYYREKELDPGYDGIFEKRYTDAFVKYMGGGYADAVATGTASLYIAVAALQLPPGSEVIVSPITDPGSLASIILNGLVPRLAARTLEFAISPGLVPRLAARPCGVRRSNRSTGSICPALPAKPRNR